MKLLTCFLGLILLIGYVAAFPQWPFSSSTYNRNIANREYANNPIQRYVATAFGDEIPRMRDDLIRRKNNGEGAIQRHWNAWTNWGNWRPAPGNDYFERGY